MTKKYLSVVEDLRVESGLTYEDLARELGVTVGCVMKWKQKGVTLETIIILLRFASARRLRKASSSLAAKLETACGELVQIRVRRARKA